jgi:hypothetical protein
MNCSVGVAIASASAIKFEEKQQILFLVRLICIVCVPLVGNKNLLLPSSRDSANLIYILNDPLALQLRLYLSMYINIRL